MVASEVGEPAVVGGDDAAVFTVASPASSFGREELPPTFPATPLSPFFRIWRAREL